MRTELRGSRFDFHIHLPQESVGKDDRPRISGDDNLLVDEHPDPSMTGRSQRNGIHLSHLDPSHLDVGPLLKPVYGTEFGIEGIGVLRLHGVMRKTERKEDEGAHRKKHKKPEPRFRRKLHKGTPLKENIT